MLTESQVAALTVALRSCVEAEGHSKMPVNDIKLLRCKAELEHEVQKILAIDDVDALEAAKKFFTEAKSSVKQLITGSKKAASKVTSYINNGIRAKERAAKKRVTEQEKKDLAEARRAAKDAAAHVETQKVKPLFEDWSAVVGTSGVKAIDSPANGTLEVDTPWLLQASQHASLTDSWKKNPKVQLAMSNFGGQYKKDDTTKVDGKGQMPFQSAEGKAETLAFFSAIIDKMKEKPVASDKIPSGSTIMNNAWLWGYMPKLNTAGETPYGIGVIRCLAMGEMQVMVVGYKQLVAALGAQATPEVLRAALLDCKADGIKQLVDKNCEIYVGSVKPYDVLFVPSGYMMVEFASAGTLIYGARKSVVHATQKAVDNLSSLIASRHQTNSNSTKLGKLLDTPKEIVGNS